MSGSNPAVLSLLLAAAALPVAGGSGPSERGGAARIPVLAWIGPPANDCTAARYRELVTCGFTANYSGFPDAAAVARALDVAQAAGVRQFVDILALGGDVEANIRRFRHHPALGGYFIRDEPAAGDFAALARSVKRIQEVDPRRPCYVNLFPNYATPAQLGAPTYQEYVDRFVAEVPVPVLSFDNYPVTSSGLRPGWYENLEVVARAARMARKPFWAFALSVAHGPYPVARVEHLRLQAFSDLAYGAQAIQYFTYWTPQSTDWNFHMAPIDGGKRTEVYDRVKQVNAEIQGLARVFAGAQVLRVGHTGRLPQGVEPYRAEAPVRTIRTEGDGAVVSLLARGRRRFVAFVNRDYQHPMPLTVELDGSVPVREERKDGSSIAVDRRFTRAVEPGDMVVLGWPQ